MGVQEVLVSLERYRIFCFRKPTLLRWPRTTFSLPNWSCHHLCADMEEHAQFIVCTKIGLWDGPDRLFACVLVFTLVHLSSTHLLSRRDRYLKVVSLFPGTSSSHRVSSFRFRTPVNGLGIGEVSFPHRSRKWNHAQWTLGTPIAARVFKVTRGESQWCC